MVRQWSLKVFITLWLVLGVTFVALAAALGVAAAGYRVNWQAKTLQKTGLLLIGSDPKDAIIVLNGETLPLKTPARLGYLLPGLYDVEVQKEGYVPWKKTVRIDEGQAANERKITLFKEVPEELTLLPDEQKSLTERISSITPALRDDELEVRGREIWVGEELVSRLLGGDIRQVRWFPTKGAFFVQLNNALHLYQRDGSNDRVIASFNSAEAVPFFVDGGGTRLVFQQGEEVIALKIH